MFLLGVVYYNICHRSGSGHAPPGYQSLDPLKIASGAVSRLQSNLQTYMLVLCIARRASDKALQIRQVDTPCRIVLGKHEWAGHLLA